MTDPKVLLLTDEEVSKKDGPEGNAVKKAFVEHFNYVEQHTATPEIYKIPIKATVFLFWFFLLMFFSAIYWSLTSYLDEVAFGRGRVIPSSQVQAVQNLEGGIITEMLVSVGDIVEKGDILARLDPATFDASIKGDTVLLQGLQAREIRLIAEAEGKSPNFDGLNIEANTIENERQSYQARQLKLTSDKSVLESQLQQRRTELQEVKANLVKIRGSLKSLDEEISMTRPMVERGISSRIELLRLEREANDLRGDIEIALSAANRIEASISEAQNRIQNLQLDFQSQARTELSETRVSIESLQQQMSIAQNQATRTIITAPLSGIVNQIYMNTIGGVVRSGETFIELVPTGEVLVVEVRIDPKDIGFIHPGQSAQVRLTAYDSSIYGAMEATVQRVGADSITEDSTGEVYYKVYVETKKQYVGTEQKKLPILPGMLADVSIITGQRTVMDYFLKPIRRIKERALREP